MAKNRFGAIGCSIEALPRCGIWNFLFLVVSPLPLQLKNRTEVLQLTSDGVWWADTSLSQGLADGNPAIWAGVPGRIPSTLRQRRNYWSRMPWNSAPLSLKRMR
jgi:hypothetical protein